MANHSSASTQWTSQMFLRALSDGIQNVPDDLPLLRIITVGCLDKNHFEQLQAAISKIPSSQLRLHYIAKAEEEEEEVYEAISYSSYNYGDAEITLADLEDLRAEQLYWSQSS
jgi:hypothetical protein